MQASAHRAAPAGVSRRARRGGLAIAAAAAVLAAAAARHIGGVARLEDVYLTPEEGLGYGLGVAGLAMMTALLAYSARKRLGFLRDVGPIRPWFSVHMALGILGPLLIL